MWKKSFTDKKDLNILIFMLLIWTKENYFCPVLHLPGHPDFLQTKGMLCAHCIVTTAILTCNKLTRHNDLGMLFILSVDVINENTYNLSGNFLYILRNRTHSGFHQRKNRIFIK